MKRLWMILLVISVLLCGCNSASVDSKEDSAKEDFSIGNMIEEMIMGEPDEDTCMVTVQVKVNPVFELYLNAEHMILEIFCLNEDAQTLFEGLDVVGKTYEEGMSLLLDTAYELEFITAETTEIQMEITAQEDRMMLEYKT